MTIIFAAIMLLGVLYLLLTIFGGIDDAADIGSAIGLNTEAEGLGCSVIASFLAGFGAVGLTGSLAGWSMPTILLIALAFGMLLAWVLMRALRYVYNQQSTSPYSIQDLIGLSGRVTIDTQPGQTSEIIIEQGEILKYPVKEINGAELKRGDLVEVLDVSGRHLRVKKKR